MNKSSAIDDRTKSPWKNSYSVMRPLNFTCTLKPKEPARWRTWAGGRGHAQLLEVIADPRHEEY